MADVDGSLMSNDFFDPLRENATGQILSTDFFDPLDEDSPLTAVPNCTGGGGGATIVRQNPELTRTSP